MRELYKMTEDKRKLEKHGNEFKITVDSQGGRKVQMAIFSKAEMRENLNLLNANLQAVMVKKSSMDKELKKLSVIDTPKLRKFIEQIKNAQALEKKVQIEKQMKLIMRDIKTYNAQKQEIRLVLPELFRGQKK